LPPNLPIVPPLDLPPGETYVEIALGASFAAGIRASDGGIDTWGGVFAGGPPPYQPADFKPKSPSVKFIALTAGGGHGVAITEDGVLEQWGGPSSGTPPKPPGRTFVEVRARSSLSIARDDKGQLYGWGSGLFAPGSPPLLEDPQWEFVDEGYWLNPGPFFAIAASAGHILALNLGDDSVSGWGSNFDGECTDAPKGVAFMAVGAGRNYSIGLDRDGKLHHWGNSLPTTTISSGTPRGRELLKHVPAGRFSAISAGTTHATALRRDPRVDADKIVDRVIPDRP
jgi:alpha-tubulin suppressor-like RCC1 family protein